MINIAGTDFKEEQVTKFDFNGIEENNIKSISQNGSKRENVLINRTFSYTLGISSIDKFTFEKFFAVLESLSDSYAKIQLEVKGIIRAEIINYAGAIQVPNVMQFEFDLTQCRFTNNGGWYDIEIPLKYIRYY